MGGQPEYNAVLSIRLYHFIDERDNLLWKVRALEVSTSPSALSGDTLGDRVVGDEPDRTVHLPYDLLKGGE